MRTLHRLLLGGAMSLALVLSGMDMHAQGFNFDYDFGRGGGGGDAGFHIGLAAEGVAVNELHNAGAGTSSAWAAGFRVGPALSLGFSHLSIDSGIYYQNISDQAGDKSYKHHALVVPLELRFNFLDEDYDVNPFIYAGPAFEYGLAASLSRMEGGVRRFYNAYHPQDGYQNRINYYLGGGLGVQLFGAFLLKAGYSYSMMNYYRPHLWTIDENYTTRRGQFTGSLVVLF